MDLYNKNNEEYGELFYSFLLEQWKTMIQTADKISNRSDIIGKKSY